MTRSAALTGVCALVTALLPPGTMVAAPTVHRQGMQPFVIAARGAFPVIDGRVVIWSVGRTVPGGGYIPHADLEGLDLSTGRRFPVLSGGTAAGTVALSGKTAVWVDCRH